MPLTHGPGDTDQSQWVLPLRSSWSGGPVVKEKTVTAQGVCTSQGWGFGSCWAGWSSLWNLNTPSLQSGA